MNNTDRHTGNDGLNKPAPLHGHSMPEPDIPPPGKDPETTPVPDEEPVFDPVPIQEPTPPQPPIKT